MKNHSRLSRIRRIGCLMLALCIGLMLLPTAAIAEEVEPELGIIGIGGQIIRYPLQETSYWHYDESTGVTAAATEENANITLISTNSEEAPPIDRPVFQSEGDEPPTDADTALLIVQLDHVHITTSHHFEGSDFNDFALFYPGDQLIVQALGDCSLTGSQYGIYTEGYLTLNGLDSESALTVTANSEAIGLSLPTDAGGDGDSDGDAVYEGPMAIFSFRTVLAFNEDASDFILTVRSNTGTLVSSEPMLWGTRVELYTSNGFDGENPTRHTMNDDGKFDGVEKINAYPYVQYKVGTEVYAPVQVTGATLQFQPGDKPVFTGKVVPEDADKYTIVEEWALLDGNGNAVRWCSSDEAKNPAEEQLLTAFEAGKTYHYSVYAYTKELFTVFAADAKLVLNGETIAVPVMEAPDSTFVAQYVKELTPQTPTVTPPVTPPEDNGSTGKPSTDVKTGETTPYSLWLGLLFVSGGIVAAVGGTRRKRA